MLTSLDGAALARQGIAGSAQEQVLRLAALAHGAGLAGVIASPQEVAALRAEHGPDFHIVVPGIRPAGGSEGDQARVATPADAARAIADEIAAAT